MLGEMIVYSSEKRIYHAVFHSTSNEQIIKQFQVILWDSEVSSFNLDAR